MSVTNVARGDESYKSPGSGSGIIPEPELVCSNFDDSCVRRENEDTFDLSRSVSVLALQERPDPNYSTNSTKGDDPSLHQMNTPKVFNDEVSSPAVASSRNTPTLSAKYIAEKNRFARNQSNDITYDGRVVCRYYSTQRGCRADENCRFLHKELGCVFFQQAKQGCIFEQSGECPFSHDPDVVVMAPDLNDCSTPGCERSCMNTGSSCIICFNSSSRERRENVKSQQRSRRENFHIDHGQQHGTQPQHRMQHTAAHPYLQPVMSPTAVPTQHSYFTPQHQFPMNVMTTQPYDLRYNANNIPRVPCTMVYHPWSQNRW